MLKAIILSTCLAVALSTTNHYIGSLTALGSSSNFPFPVDKCCISTYSLTGSNVYTKFTCNNASSITATTYSDAACSTVSTTTVYAASTATAGKINSYVCGADDSNYAGITAFFASTCTGLNITSYYATNVCYYTTAGFNSKATCTDTDVSISTYGTTDTTCASTLLATPTNLTATTCVKLSATVYGQMSECYTGDDDDSAYIPSLMTIVALLVFSVASLL